MNTAPVGVFILSPEFAARNWTMAELMCFQKRERDALKDRRPLPILIPVFYRLDVHTCRKTQLFYQTDESGENAFLKDRFFDRVLGGKITVSQVADSMKEITMRTGIENQDEVSNAVTADMQSLRSTFIDHIVGKIEAAVNKAKASGAEDDAVRYWRAVESTIEEANAGASGGVWTAHGERDSFAPYFEIWENPRYVFFGNGESASSSGAQNSKAKARGILLEKQSGGHTVLAIQGMPGVGKTCTLRALCHDEEIQSRFMDGIYVIRLGADAVLQTFLAGLSRIAEESGGHHLAAGIMQSKRLESAVHSCKKWFANRACLFLLDDVWSRPVDGTEYLDGLSCICAGGTESAMVFSTREKELLVHSTVTHEFQLFSHEPRSDICRAILLQCSMGDRNAVLLPLSELAVTGLLDSCCGLPVALAVTGRATRKLAIDMGRDYDRAIQTYYNMNENDASQVVDRRADKYSSLSMALMTSINVLEQCMASEEVAPLPYSHSKMHGGLCVLKKQEWAPLSMLQSLWGLPSIEDANIVVDQFSEVGLVDVQFRKIGDNEVKGIQLHDLVHDVATRNAVKANEGSVWHARLLHGYSSVDGKNVPMKEGCREWWKAERGVDKYVDENVVRHLIGAGDVCEAVLLVTRPQWIARLLERCTILSLEQDIDLVTRALETLPDEVTERKDTIEGLRLVRNCVRAGLSAILDNPREVYFQITARLFYAKDSSSFVKRIVQYAERHAVKPCLKNVSACAQQAETVRGKKFPCFRVRCMQVVENEGIVIAGGYGGKIAVFDMETCERMAEWKAHENGVSCLTATTDERLLASGSFDKTAKLWDMTNAFAIVAVFEVGCGVWSIHVTPENQRCIVGDDDGTVSVWELESERCVVPELGKHERCVTSVAVSLDGQLVASGDWDGGIKLWSLNGESEMDSAHSARIAGNLRTSLLLRALASLIQAGTGDHGSDSSNVSLVATLEGHTDRIRTLCFTKDGSKLLSGSCDKTVRLWDVVREMQIEGALYEHTGSVISVSLRDDEHEIFSVGDDGAMCVWRMDGNLERRVQFAEKEVWMNDVKIISGGEKVVWYDWNWVHATDVRSELSAIACGSQHKDAVSAVCVSPNGTRVISKSLDGSIIVWDSATGLQVGTTIEGHESWVTDVAVTPDGQRFVSVSGDGTVRLWDLETHEQLAVLEGHSNWVNCVEISLDGKTAITRSDDETVLIWDLDACDGSHKVLEGHSGAVRRLYLAQDVQHFVSLSEEDAILWNMETAEIVKRIETGYADSLSMDELEGLFGVPMNWNLRMGDIRLGRNRNKITYYHNCAKLVLATLDSGIGSMDFSQVPKTLCVGLSSGHVGIFELELEDDLDLVLLEE